MPEPANFSASYRPGVGCPTVGNGPKKFKNLNLIKSLPKRKMPKRKGHTSFWGFSSLGFKLVLIDSELNSALGNQTVFTKKLGVALVVLRKAAKLKNVG